MTSSSETNNKLQFFYKFCNILIFCCHISLLRLLLCVNPVGRPGGVWVRIHPLKLFTEYDTQEVVEILQYRIYGKHGLFVNIPFSSLRAYIRLFPIFIKIWFSNTLLRRYLPSDNYMTSQFIFSCSNKCMKPYNKLTFPAIYPQ